MMMIRLLQGRARMAAWVLLAWTCCAYGAPPVFAQADAPVSASTPSVFDEPALVQRYQGTITPDELAGHLYLFASDAFEGRETGMPGQKLAAAYLASQYREMGLEPRGTTETTHPYDPAAYFQSFPLYGQRLQEAHLRVLVDGDTVATSVFGTDRRDGRSLLVRGAAPATEGGVVFAGYGIADDALGYNDYAAAQAQGLDLAGKWVMILADEPLADAETSRLPTEDGKPSAWTTDSYEKLRALYGVTPPTGILVVAETSPRTATSLVEQAEAAAAGLAHSAGNLSLTPQPASPRQGAPMYMISKELANQILAPSGRTVEAVQQTIDQTLEPVVFEVEDVTVKSTIENPTVQLQTENVLAFIEGSDPALKDEVVVLTSHYDHVGINPWQAGDNINNGADDDGSGTVTLLEIAEAFMRAREDGYGPRRSILFMNVTGEEKGLLGSSYYADVDPVIPLDRTVTNLNIDMIGRFDPSHPTGSENYVYIIGSNLISEELHDINLRTNEVTGVDLELDERFNSKDDPNRFYARSDHWNFGKHGVPFIFFFTGTHEDYHQPGDEAHKIEYDRMARIGRLIFATAWQVANQDERPAVSGTGFN